MRKGKVKTALLAILCGTALGSGCLGGGLMRQVLVGSALYTGLEFVTDGGVFDLFPDGGAAQ